MKIKNYIKKNKKTVVIASIVLLILILLLAVINTLMPDNGKSVCGNRVADIKNHPVENASKDKVVKALKNTSKITDVEVNVVCRKISFVAKVSDGVSVEDAKATSSLILENLSDDIKGYYDIEIIYSSNADGYPFSGYKQRSRDNFVF